MKKIFLLLGVLLVIGLSGCAKEVTLADINVEFCQKNPEEELCSTLALTEEQAYVNLVGFIEEYEDDAIDSTEFCTYYYDEMYLTQCVITRDAELELEPDTNVFLFDQRGEYYLAGISFSNNYSEEHIEYHHFYFSYDDEYNVTYEVEYKDDVMYYTDFKEFSEIFLAAINEDISNEVIAEFFFVEEQYEDILDLLNTIETNGYTVEYDSLVDKTEYYELHFDMNGEETIWILDFVVDNYDLYMEFYTD
jgi:hypothetical protein